MSQPTNRWKLGGSFTLGNHTLRGQFETAEGYGERFGGQAPLSQAGLTAEGTGGDAKFFWLAYIYKTGNNTLMLSWGRDDFDDSKAVDEDYSTDAFTIAARHNFSKTFSVFGGFKYWSTDDDVSIDDEDDPDVSAFSIGMRKDFKI